MFARIAGFVSFVVLVATTASAQQYRSQLRGSVLAADGTPAAGTVLRITAEDTGGSRRFVSDGDGRYLLAGLLPGTYRISGDDDRSRGFAVRTQLSVHQDLELNLRLGVVAMTAAADVRDTFVPIDRHTAAMTTRIDGDFLLRLPLDGRNLLDAVLLAPGVAPGASGVTINGTFEPFTGYLLDGIYDIASGVGVPLARPQIDAIREMEVRTSPLDASFGRTAGGQVNIITRSGTNRAAAGAFGFLQPDGDASQLGGSAGGPLSVDQTFAFSAYQHTRQDEAPVKRAGHLLTGRVDHIAHTSSRLAARYGLDTGVAFDRRGHNLGGSFHSVPSPSITNEARAGVSRLTSGGADRVPSAESTAYQVANATTWSSGPHIVTAGAEWYGFSRGGDSEQMSSSWALFVQDEWRASPSVSLSGGLRFDAVSLQPDLDRENSLSPRLGVAWTVDREARTVVRGGFGVHRQSEAIQNVVPRIEGWSLSVQRQIGRSRAFEAAYVASRGENLFGSTRYDALQLELEQRSEDGISGIAAYTYGKWTEDPFDTGEPVRVPLDSRHRLSLGLVAALPFGEERRWFSKGVAATILRDMELSAVGTLQTGQPIPGVLERQGPSHRNVDVGLLKNVVLRDRRTLQFRLETFNLTDRVNWLRGRRYQLGARFLF